MKSPFAFTLIFIGGGLMISTLYLDYWQHSLLREILGFGAGLLIIAVASLFIAADRLFSLCSTTSTDNDENPKPSWTDVGMLIVTFLGFGLTIYMIYDAADAFKSTNYSNASPMILDLDKKFVEQPDLRKYFYQDGTNPIYCAHLGDTNYVEVMAMSEFVLDTFDSFLAQRVRYGHQAIDKDWTDWMKDTFSHSPSMVLYMEEHTNWYRSGELYKVYLDWTTNNPNGVKNALLEFSQPPKGK